jgi:hypothetical protein
MKNRHSEKERKRGEMEEVERERETVAENHSQKLTSQHTISFHMVAKGSTVSLKVLLQ